MNIDFRAYPILYVDDEAANLITVRYLLEGSFELLTAQTGEDALAQLAARDDIAVLLCDQRMPGMSGVEVCERARAIRPDAVRIMITAYTDLHAAVDAINRGQVARYVQKPFRNEELVAVLQTAISLVHVQRTVQSLEVGLLSSGQVMGARTVEAQIGHELGNVLVGVEANVAYASDLIKTALEIVGEDGGRLRDLLEEAAAGHVDAHISVEQMKNILRRLKQGELSKRPPRCHVDRVVDSTVRILRNEVEKVARIQLIIAGTPRVEMEASVLAQVVTNLLLNAAQAVQEHGVKDDAIVVEVVAEDDKAILRVRDRGPGIADEHLERIFDPHFTTKSGGNGLGLAIVREMVTSAGGRVRVQSTPEGSTFTVELPLLPPASSHPPSH